MERKTFKKMKKNRKPRTAVDRKVNQLLSKFRTECQCWDGGYPECMLSWSHSGEGGCNGNQFVCRKLYHKYLASVENPSPGIIEEFERRNII